MKKMKKLIIFGAVVPWPVFWTVIANVIIGEVTEIVIGIALGFLLFQLLCITCYMEFFRYNR